MCGSGTFVIEAAMLALNRAPGMYRKTYPFERWPDHNAKLWHACSQEARSLAGTTLPFKIGANDRHAGALSLARRDAKAAGVQGCISFSEGDVEAYVPGRDVAKIRLDEVWAGIRLAAPEAS